ncbi:MAG: ribonuclease HII, partial [Acidobacteria bacterium]|nr:ribonuclease HII [Acidobacteriota bacterium]
EIDQLNIHRASLLAMRGAVMALVPLPGLVLVDGFPLPAFALAQRAVVGGDRTVSAIAAASIVAKVHRDRLMCELHGRDPRYGFDRHKGYATRDHLAAVERFGYSEAHRQTFRAPTLFPLSDTITH